MKRISTRKGLARVPVVYKGTPLMPMTWKRAREFIKSKNAVLVKTKNLGWYLKLKIPPSSYQTQKVSLGIDPGSKFNGYSVVTNYVHNANFQRNTLNSSVIQKHNSIRSIWRRNRRGRLRYRKSRYNWRNGTRYSKTAMYLWQVRLQMIWDIVQLYPITDIVVENVSCNNSTRLNGNQFSNVEIGKNYFRNNINRLLNVNYQEISGLITYRNRIKYCKKDLKSANKNDKSFYAHCLDSFIIANTIFDTTKRLNHKLILIEDRYNKYGHRCLRDFTASKGRATLCYWKPLKHFRSTSLLNDKTRKSLSRYYKIHKIRVKQEGAKSNHGPWTYLYDYQPNSVKLIKRRFVNITLKSNKNWLTGFYELSLNRIIIN